MLFATSGKNRVPRVLFFINGVHPTDEEREAAAEFAPNVGIRNAQQVATLAMSPLEECDAVAGPAIPERYLKVYPNVNGFDGGARMLRMSDLDRRTDLGVHSEDNEAARAAKPPAVGGDVISAQGAQRPAGAFTAALSGGGFVAPRPGNPDNVLMSGSERAENAPEGSRGEGTQAPRENPHQLPDAGVLQARAGDTGSTGGDAVTGGAVTTASVPTGFTPPQPVETSANGDTGSTGPKGGKAKGDKGASGDTGATG